LSSISQVLLLFDWDVTLLETRIIKGYFWKCFGYSLSKSRWIERFHRTAYAHWKTLCYEAKAWGDSENTWSCASGI